MKKLIAVLMTLVMVFSTLTCLSGCSDEKYIHILTRGEWINKVAQVFQMNECYDNTQRYDDVSRDSEYFNAIQACAEWKIIDDEKNFCPDERANVDFAIITAVKAVGIDKISKSKDGKKLNNNDDIIDYFNDKCNVSYIPGSNLYEDTAQQIVTEISNLYASLELKQYQDVKYTDSVKMANENDIVFSADGETAKIKKDNSYKVGDIITIEPTSTYPKGKYAKVTSVKDDSIKYTEPTLEEMYDHVIASGTYQPEILGVIPLTDGVEVASIEGYDVMPQKYNEDNDNEVEFVKNLSESNNVVPTANEISLGDIEINISKSIAENIDDTELKHGKYSESAKLSILGTIGLNDIKVSTDLDIWGPIVNKAEINVMSTLNTKLSIEGELETTIECAKIPCRLFSTVGIDIILAIKIGISGEISVVWSVDTAAGLEYMPLRTTKYMAKGSNSNLDVEIKVKSSIKPEVKAELVLGPVDIASIGVYSGIEASIGTKIGGTSSDVQCVDIDAYVPLAFFVGAEGESDTLLGKLGIKKTWSLWTSSTSPVKKNWHVESGKIVPKCTKKDKVEETTAPNEINNDGFSHDEDEIDTELIKAINNVDDNLAISSYFAAIEENGTDKIKVSNLPEGYNESSIVFSSDDSEVASIDSNGNIKANSSGVCRIKVATDDGKYSQYCAIRVLASYNVNFTPLVFSTGRELGNAFEV